ncbi:hypothetical protein ACE1OC_01115 [Streptomyces sp. DSM 116496]|uniref:hypothetical protein n=1 Tax=Streptomyces stoeckheimensis TaxID=3344656 RepID=UPI0038B267EE
MGLFDKLTGTRHPDRGVAPRSAEEVRATLLGLFAADAPYVVRGGAPEGADLVAEWRIQEPAWHTFFARTQVSRVLQIRLRLDAAAREVRSVDRQFDVTWLGDTPRLALSAEAARGQVTTVSRRWKVERDADGGLGATEVFRFDNSDLKDPLREAVLAAGWTWRGVAFGKL